MQLEYLFLWNSKYSQAMASSSNNLRQRRNSSPSPSPTNPLLNTLRTAEEKIERTLLLTWNDLPHWRQDNAYIITGYRPTSASYTHSFLSIFTLHNESVNIWTHLLGALFFTSVGLGALYFSSHVIAPRYASAGHADVVALAGFFVGAFCCLGMSATFHALCNHSAEVARWGNKLDYTGIVFLIVGSYVPALFYGFYCLPRLMEVYLAGVSHSCLPLKDLETT